MKLTIVIPLYLSDPLHMDFTRQTLESIKTKHDYEVILIVNYCSPSLETDLSSLLTTHRSLFTNDKGNILASAWNLGMKIAFSSSTLGEAELAQSLRSERAQRNRVPRLKAEETGSSSTRDRKLEPKSDYCLILNNDLILHPQAIDNLVTFAESHPDFLLWTMTEWSDMRTLAKAKWDGSFSLHPHFSAFMVNHRTLQLIGWFDENLRPAYFEDNDYHIRILLKGKHAAATTTAKFYHFGSRTVNVDDALKPSVKAGYQQNRIYMKKKWGLDPHGKAFDPPEEILKHITRPDKS